MADYTLSAKGTYDGSNFNKGIDQSGSKLESFKGKCTSISVMIGNLLSGAVQKVGSAINSSMDAAISRVDTMNNFSKVMANMGISADEANEAIRTLSGDALKGLPTTLDSAVSGVQRLTSKNQDVRKSTDYFLAMNNAIVAGGTDMGIQQSAIEQLSQAYSKGKMDMQEWRTLQMAMPAQLNQVAKAMNMTSDELGEGLRKGNVSMDDFMNTLVKLNKEGVEGFASLEEQARSATGGIATQMTNMNTAVTRGVANVIDKFNSTGAITKTLTFITNGIDALGKAAAPVAETIGKRFSSGLDAFKSKLDSTGDPLKAFSVGITTAFKGTPVESFAKAVGKFVRSISADIQSVMPIAKSVLSIAKEVAIGVINAISSISPATVKGIALAVAVSAAVMKIITVVKTLKTTMAATVAAVNPVTFAFTAVVAVLALLATGFIDARQKQEKFNKATSGLVDAVKSLGKESDAAADGIGAVGDSASDSTGNLRDYALTVDELIEKQGELAQSITEKFGDVNAQNAALQAYADKIAELAGNCDGSAEKVAELQAAVDGYNQIAGTSYEITDDFNGALNESTEELLKNAEAFKARAKAAAAQEVLTELWKESFEAQKTLDQATADYNETLAQYGDIANDTRNNADMREFAQAQIDAAKQTKDEAQAAFDATAESIEAMGDTLIEATLDAQNYKGGLANAIKGNSAFKASLEKLGISVEDAASQLSDLGFTAEKTSELSEEQFEAMASSANLSLGEIVKRCDELGIEMPASLQGAISASEDVMNKGGSEAAASWIKGMSAKEYAVVKNAAEISGKSTAEFVAQAEAMGAAGKDDVLAFAQGIYTEKPKSDAAASETAASASNALNENTDGSTAGETLSSEFSDSIRTDAGNIKAARMADNAHDEAIGKAKLTSDIGAYFSEGAARGINVLAMVSNAVTMVRNAIDAANKEAQIASPSKVMRRFGRFFSQGAAIGVDDEADLMAKNTVSMVRGAISSVKRMPSPTIGTLGFSGANLHVRATSSVRKNGAAAVGAVDSETMLGRLYNEVADLNSSLGKKIADNAPVVVESERQASRRYRRAQYD